MMRNEIKSLEQLRDSKLLYDKKTPLFGRALVIIFSVLLSVIIIWSINTKKVATIKSNGLIKSVNQNYVMSSYTGEIISINIWEGQWIVNTFLDNFFKGIFFKLSWC